MASKNQRADRVWKRFSQAYGARFAEAYGPNPTEPWIDAIEDLTDEQVAYGIKAVQRETPIHPPTLGQFTKCSRDLPIAQQATGPSLQEQLSAYVIVIRPGMHPDQRAAPWTYLYRDWIDTTRPKATQRCAECIGVLIAGVDGHEGFRVDVADMVADTAGHAKALRSFRPGQRRSQPLQTENLLA